MPHDEFWNVKMFYANGAKHDTHSHTNGTLIDMTISSVPTDETRADELRPTSIVS